MDALSLADSLVFLATGVAAGLLAGLLGVGGGLIIVAVLVHVLPAFGVASDEVTRVALATSLASIIATSVSSSYAHHRRGAVLWRTVGWLVPGLLLGGVVGAQIAGALSDRVLRLGVAGFCFVAAWRLARTDAGLDPDSDLTPRGEILTFSGVFIGILSALVGIGGGSMTVPLLIAFGARPVRAVGTSAACGFAIALASACGFVIAGRHTTGLPAGTLGYVYLPAALLIALASVAVAPLGARLAHRLRGATLKRIFAGFLVLIGVSVLATAVQH